jgi:hypothetical protein
MLYIKTNVNWPNVFQCTDNFKFELYLKKHSKEISLQRFLGQSALYFASHKIKEKKIWDIVDNWKNTTNTVFVVNFFSDQIKSSMDANYIFYIICLKIKKVNFYSVYKKKFCSKYKYLYLHSKARRGGGGGPPPPRRGGGEVGV